MHWLLMLKLYWNYWLFLVNNSCIPKYQHQIDIDIFYALNVRIGIRSVLKSDIGTSQLLTFAY